MSKRNVVFNKPDEPLFLKKLKQQIGYCEGPTVETKREKLPYLYNDDDERENLDDQPTVVVLKPGDLNAEEVEAEKKKEKAEKESEPADLSKKILFRPSKKNDKEGSAGVSKNTPIFEKTKSTKQERESSSKLSFYQEDEEEEEDDH